MSPLSLLRIPAVAHFHHLVPAHLCSYAPVTFSMAPVDARVPRAQSCAPRCVLLLTVDAPLLELLPFFSPLI